MSVMPIYSLVSSLGGKTRGREGGREGGRGGEGRHTFLKEGRREGGREGVGNLLAVPIPLHVRHANVQLGLLLGGQVFFNLTLDAPEHEGFQDLREGGREDGEIC